MSRTADRYGRSMVPSSTEMMLHVPNLIKNDIDRIDGDKKKFEMVFDQINRATVYGEITEVKVEKNAATGKMEQTIVKVGDKTHHLDEEMWKFLRDLIVYRLPGYISTYLGAQGEKFTMDVLDRFHMKLQRTVTIQQGTTRLAKEIQRYKAPEAQEEGEGEKTKPEIPRMESEPVQFIQHVGQPLPNELAIFDGSLEERLAGVQKLIFRSRRQWEKMWIQTQFSNDEFTGRVNFGKVVSDIDKICQEIKPIGLSAFDSIKREIRQQAFKMAEAQLQQMMLMGRQRRDYAWGYTGERQTVGGMLDYAARSEELERREVERSIREGEQQQQQESMDVVEGEKSIQ